MLAEASERPIGLAWVRIEPEHPAIATLYQVWVNPDYRRQGVGRTLLDAAIVWARAANASRLMLSVARGPGSALPFYKHAGFTEVGEPSPLRADSDLLQQLMQRAL